MHHFERIFKPFGGSQIPIPPKKPDESENYHEWNRPIPTGIYQVNVVRGEGGTINDRTTPIIEAILTEIEDPKATGRHYVDVTTQGNTGKHQADYFYITLVTLCDIHPGLQSLLQPYSEQLGDHIYGIHFQLEKCE